MSTLRWIDTGRDGHAIGLAELGGALLRLEVYMTRDKSEFIYTASLVTPHDEPLEFVVGSAESLAEAQRLVVFETREWLNAALEALGDEPEGD